MPSRAKSRGRLSNRERLEKHFVLNRKRVLGAMHQISDCFVYSALPASPPWAERTTLPKMGIRDFPVKRGVGTVHLTHSGLTNASKPISFQRGQKVLHETAGDGPMGLDSSFEEASPWKKFEGEGNYATFDDSTIVSSPFF